MAYGTPRVARRRRGATTPTSAGGVRRPPEQLADLAPRYDAIGGISPLAERTEAQRAAIAAALDERRPGELRRGARPEARRAVHRGRGGHPGRSGRHPRRRARARPPLLGASVGQYQARAAEAGAERGRRPRRHRQWHLEPAYLDFLDRRPGRRPGRRCPSTTRCCSPPTRCPSAPWSTIPTPTSCARARRRWPSGSASGPGRTGPSPGRARAARPSPGAAPTSSRSSASSAPPGAARAWSSARGLHVRPPRGALRPRHRGRRRWRPSAGLAFARTRSLNDDPTVMGALADLVIAVADRSRADAGA